MYTVVAQRWIDVPVDVVWQHLARPELLARWFADASRLGSGQRARFDFGDGDFHHARILQWEPEIALAFRWSFLDLGPETEVTWALLRRKDGTEVSFIERGALTLAEAECLRVGWNEFLMRLEKTAVQGERTRFNWRKMISLTARVEGEPAAALEPLRTAAWYRTALDGVCAEVVGDDHEVRGRLTHEDWQGAVTDLEIRRERVKDRDYLYLVHDGFGALPEAVARTERRRFVDVWRDAMARLPVS